MVKKIRDLGAAAIVLIVLVIAIVGITYAVGKVGFTAIEMFVERSAGILMEQYREYLFFIGTTIAALKFLSDKKFKVAFILFSIGVLWVLFYQPFSYWMGSLGSDSFSEAKNFDWVEAKFWLGTFVGMLTPSLDVKALLSLLSYLSLAICLFVLFNLAFKKLAVKNRITSYVTFSCASFFVLVSLFLCFSNLVVLFIENSSSYENTLNNFNNKLPDVSLDDKNINLVVYIGESTSVMDMGLYGYPRNTTPELSNLKTHDENFIVFNNVFSTHTHTSSSLLEAFSLGVDKNQDFLPINDRKRMSIIDILHKANIDPVLLSNQGITGTWNQAGSIVFRNARRIFSADNKALGSSDELQTKPYDDVFFENSFNKNIQGYIKADQKNIVFLHSYGGHGPYLRNIPESFHQHVDDYFSSAQKRALLQNDAKLIENVENYDSAIRYVDYSVTKIIKDIKNNDSPVIFVYFSDHGDSAYTASAHDSSRFAHEMARIPFVMYFNDAAREKYRSIFEKYKNLAASNTITTLAQLPSTLFDLIGIRIQSNSKANEYPQPPVIGVPTLLPPIVVRETESGITYIDLNKKRLIPHKEKNTLPKFNNDYSTNIFIQFFYGRPEKPSYCEQNTNSLVNMMRSIIVAKCSL